MNPVRRSGGRGFILWSCAGVLLSACSDACGPRRDAGGVVRSGDKGAAGADSDAAAAADATVSATDGGPGMTAAHGGADAAAHAGRPDRDAAADGGGTPQDAAAEGGESNHYDWRLPPGFPTPVVPEDNPMTTAKVELGRHLFYDDRLSGNQTQSCASCHKQALAFSDGRATGLGSTGKAHPRGPMSLANIAYSTSLTWANPLFAMGVLSEPLERQTLIPIYGDAPVELGMKSQSELVERLRQVDRYRALFRAAFPKDDEPLNAQNIGRALAAFERVLISGDSAYDRYLGGDESALTPSEARGLALFESDRLQCSECHSGFNLSEHVHYKGEAQIALRYRNTGLYNIDGRGAYPTPNTGVFDVTMDPRDMGKFKVPTLRNIALTAPYMHDGSIASLSEVIDHYAAGGRTIEEGPNAGVGRDNPLKDPLIHGFTISADERKDLIAFLSSLTDQAFLTNPAFADPWAQPTTD